jgi:2-polyprenyl-6-hydroxyphenyl methylase/3-demethylubiquinone-9 3-methyltransferase
VSANTTTVAAHAQEVEAGQRFEFGENWRRFLTLLNEERIAEAERSLTRMLGLPSLEGKTFLDVGCGSGLFSLAAARLGAARVRSLDFDPASVACAAELRRRYFPEHDSWLVEQGSALDSSYMTGLGQWDVVYSWGVLHHTGNMQLALANVEGAVAPGGRLFISIYNDQGRVSRIWLKIKQVYNALPGPLQTPYAVAVMLPRELISFSVSLVTGRLGSYLRGWTSQYTRGMSRWYDLIDWVGGYPFEVAKPEEIFDFYRSRGLTLTQLRTCRGGLGCNEYVFERPAA